MSDDERNVGLGNITTEHTVWCSRCVHWEQYDYRLKSKFIKYIESTGWRLVKSLWVCPDCLTKSETRKETK